MSLNTIAKGFSSLVLRSVGELDEETVQMADSRLQTCASCPERIKAFAMSKCKLCGCVLAAKTLVKDEKCPLDKW